METICMKCQILFSGKNKKNISKCRLLKILPRVLSIGLCLSGSHDWAYFTVTEILLCYFRNTFCYFDNTASKLHVNKYFSHISMKAYHNQPNYQIVGLTFITLSANSAEDKLVKFFPENRLLIFQAETICMNCQILSYHDFREKIPLNT